MTRSRPLTVAHVTAERSFSGGEVQLFLLLEGLRERGHRCVVVCPEGSGSAREAEARGIELLAWRPGPEWAPGGFRLLARALRRAAPDVVHLHSQRAVWFGGVCAWWLGLAAVATRRMDRRMKRGPRNRFLYGRAAQRAVGISEAVAERLRACGVAPEAIRVVPSAVDPLRLRPRLDRDVVRKDLAAGDAPVLFTAARLDTGKGLDVLLDAVARLAENGRFPRVWIAGDGPQRPALERLIRYRGLADQVRLLGWRDDVCDLMKACDVFVMPSRSEGLGVATLEAMACGVPVVASETGGLRELVEPEVTGLLVRAGDARALASALERLLRDGDLRRRFGAAGERRASVRFSAGAMIEAYEHLYAEALSLRPPRA